MRYLPHTDHHRKEMLSAIGMDSIDELFQDVSKDVYLDDAHKNADLKSLPDHQSEMAVDAHFSDLAARNIHAGQVPSFLGCGAYRHHVPATVDHLIQRGEFLTSYTPYQPEVAQGTLQYLFEFQTQVALITGMEIANASMYDGSTSCVEAVMMAQRIKRVKAGEGHVLVSGNVHPHYQDVLLTYAHFGGFEVKTEAADPEGSTESTEQKLITQITDETTCVVVQYPDVFGHIQDFTALAEACHAAGALLIVVVTEIVSLGALKTPGAMGADIVVAEGQSLGNGLNFGGPYVGLFATREEYMRQMPGRLAGQTVDEDGRTGYVLTLNTREQHIRREKATSNICTNSGLCALAFTIHLSLLGEDGFTQLADLNHAQAVKTADALTEAGFEVCNSAFFNEFTVRLPRAAKDVAEALSQQKNPVLAGVPASRLFVNDPELENHLILSATELTSDADIEALITGLKEVTA